MTHHSLAIVIAPLIGALTAVFMSLFAVYQAKKNSRPAGKDRRARHPRTMR